jgi:hypothetical protein
MRTQGARGFGKRAAMLPGARAGRTFVAAFAAAGNARAGANSTQLSPRRVRRMKKSARATSGMRSQGHTACSRSPGAREGPAPDACLAISVSASRSP